MNIDEMVAEVNRLNAERDAVVSREGKAAIASAFKEVFDAHPELEWVYWDQYAPHFNDGDACVFSVHEFRQAMVNGLEIDEPYYEQDGLSPELAKKLSKINNSLQKMEAAMATIFGEDCGVKATRDGFEIDDDISHD